MSQDKIRAKIRGLIERKKLEKFPELSTYQQLGISGPTPGDLDSISRVIAELTPKLTVELWNKDIALYRKAEKLLTKLENIIYSPPSKRNIIPTEAGHKKRLNVGTRVHRGK